MMLAPTIRTPGQWSRVWIDGLSGAAPPVLAVAGP